MVSTINSLAVGGSALTVFLVAVLIGAVLFPRCTHSRHPICCKAVFSAIKKSCRFIRYAINES